MNIVEGYYVLECSCSAPPAMEFVDTSYEHKPRFILMCVPCGKSTTACRTKENAVNMWNRRNQMLLG